MYRNGLMYFIPVPRRAGLGADRALSGLSSL